MDQCKICIFISHILTLGFKYACNFAPCTASTLTDQRLRSLRDRSVQHILSCRTTPRRVSEADQTENIADSSNVQCDWRKIICFLCWHDDQPMWSGKHNRFSVLTRWPMWIIIPPENIYSVVHTSGVQRWRKKNQWIRLKPAIFLLTPGWLTRRAYQLRNGAMLSRSGRFWFTPRSP